MNFTQEFIHLNTCLQICGGLREDCGSFRRGGSLEVWRQMTWALTVCFLPMLPGFSRSSQCGCVMSSPLTSLSYHLHPFLAVVSSESVAWNIPSSLKFLFPDYWFYSFIFHILQPDRSFPSLISPKSQPPPPLSPNSSFIYHPSEKNLAFHGHQSHMA